MDYDWPGNVRELENVIQRALVLSTGDTVTTAQLPAAIRAQAENSAVSVPTTSKELKALKKTLREKSVAEVERRFVVEALLRNDGNVSRAAAQVGMLRPNFQCLMRRYQVVPTQGRDASGAPE